MAVGARRCRAIITIAVGVSLLQAQARPSEYQVKAAYLFNFGQFVQWRTPINLSDTYPICVLGRDPFGPVLDHVLAGGTIDGRRTVVRRIGQSKDAPGCRIVFISDSEASQLPQTIAGLNTWRVLTVSDLPDFTRRGGMIQFVSSSDRVRFEVNLASAEDAGIVLSAELLKVAVLVRRVHPGA
jgi:hypothetical protein